MREALVVASGYMRQNIIEEVWAEIFDVDQSTISRYITFLTPLIDQATSGVQAIRGGGSGGHQGRDRPGRRYLVALLVLGRRA
ncbi:MAG: transposase family protein [Pseudonocardiaceae bacterium]